MKKLQLLFLALIYYIMIIDLILDPLHIVAWFFGEEWLNAVFALRSFIGLGLLALEFIYIFIGVIPYCKKRNIDSNIIGRIWTDHGGIIPKKDVYLSSVPTIIAIISVLLKFIIYPSSDSTVIIMNGIATFCSIICQHGVLVYKWLRPD